MIIQPYKSTQTSGEPRAAPRVGVCRKSSTVCIYPLYSPHYRTNTPLSSVFKNDFWGLPLSHAESHKSYRPLTVLSFRLNHRLHGLWAPGFHAVNVAAHAGVCVLFFWACLGLGASLAPSLSASLLFASHPIHTEAVSRPELSITHSHLPDTHANQLKLTSLYNNSGTSE